MREIKFRAWDKEKKVFVKGMLCFGYDDFEWVLLNDNYEQILWSYNGELQQFTGLKDKNGMGLTEVYEGDIIDENGIIKGSIYEMDKRETDIVIPQLGTKAWESAYKEAVVRGFNYSE